MTGKIMIGIDEAGCGTLAGDFFMSIVALPESATLPGVKDSKLLTDAKREDLVDSIWDAAVWHMTVDRPPWDIDKYGLGEVWRQEVCRLATLCHRQFPDGTIILDGGRGVNLPWVKPVVKADSKYLAVSAASILAKYSQTCCMEAHDKRYPQYGFLAHKGYPTKDHLAALKEHGPCLIHRMSYKPVQRVLEERKQMEFSM